MSNQESAESDNTTSLKYAGVGGYRQKILDSAENKSALKPVEEFNSLEDIEDAIADLSLELVDESWYLSPPTEVLEQLQSVYESLPSEAKDEFIADETLHRRINAARQQFETWRGRLIRDRQIPSPVEAGPANYPVKKAKKRQHSERRANKDLHERISKIKSAINGGKQRALEAIGSSLAEHNQQQAQSRTERRREQLEKGDLVIFRDPRLYMGAVYRVNQKSVRIQLNEPRAGQSKPLSDEKYGEYRRTTVSLDSSHFERVSDEEYDENADQLSQISNLDEWPPTPASARELFLGDE